MDVRCHADDHRAVPDQRSGDAEPRLRLFAPNDRRSTSVTPSMKASTNLQAKFPRLQRHGFGGAVREALNGDLGDARIGLIPAGWFRLQKETCEPELRTNETGFDVFVAVEIEDARPLSPKKLRRYCDLFDTLEYYDIGLILLVCDRYGHNQRQPDLAQLYNELVLAPWVEECVRVARRDDRPIARKVADDDAPGARP